MAYGLTNVKGITNEEIEAVEEILNDLITLLGATNNTGGSVTAGTVMAKLNKLLTDWTATRAGYIDTINTNAARLTSTRAGYIDKLANLGTTGDTGGTASADTLMAKVNKILTDWTTARAGEIDTINNAIGATGNTGGTTSAGTVMAKLNQLLTDWITTRAGYLTNLNTRLTATRAGYLDKLSNFGATGDTGGSATAGTLMAKLNKLLTSDTKQYKVSNTVRHTVTKNIENNTSKWKKMYQFHANYDGCIAAYVTVSNANVEGSLYVMRSLHDYVNTSGSGIGKNSKSMTHSSIYTAAIDSTIENLIFPVGVRYTASNNVSENTNLIYGTNHYTWNSSVDSYYGTVLLDTTIPVKKGEEIVFLVNAWSRSADVTLQIKYDEVTI